MTFISKNATSCRSSYGSCAAKVLQIVGQSHRLTTLKEISDTTGIKNATCRTCLSRLAKKHKITKLCFGYYAPLSYDAALSGSIVAGVAGNPKAVNSPEPRLHCLRLRVLKVAGTPKKWHLEFSFVKVTFQRYANWTAQVFTYCSKGCSLDYVAFRLLLEIVLREVGQTVWDKVLATSYEFNHDYAGLKLDGAKAITLTAFDGSFRRVYAKQGGLRDEVKIVGSAQVDKVLSLLKGDGVYNITQFLSDLIAEIRQDRAIMADAANSMRRLAYATFEKAANSGAKTQ